MIFVILKLCFRKKHDITKQELTDAQMEDITSYSISTQINRLIIYQMAHNHKHLLNVQVRSGVIHVYICL